MRVVRRYRGRHLRARPKRRGPVVFGAAAAVWMGGSAARAEVHVVAPGETLWGIAARYGTSVAALAEANQLRDPGLIIAGQRLRVPARVTVTSVHVVAPGETLSAIAARYGTTVAALARANRIRNVDVIIAGAELRVPHGGAAASRSATPMPQESIEATLEDHADKHDIDASLVKAVAWQESGWRQDAVSDKGAIGVMQVMPDTADYVNDALDTGGLDVREPKDNVALGVTYLDHLLETMPSENKALAAYLSGPGAVRDRLERYQRSYVRDIRALEDKF